MVAEEGKKKEDTTAPVDFTSTPMGRMMSQMMKRCCASEADSPGCASMMKGMMNDQSPRPRQGPQDEPEEKKK